MHVDGRPHSGYAWYVAVVPSLCLLHSGVWVDLLMRMHVPSDASVISTHDRSLRCVTHVGLCTGKDVALPVIDVASQKTLDIKWSMLDWAAYFSMPPKKRIEGGTRMLAVSRSFNAWRVCVHTAHMRSLPQPCTHMCPR